MNIYRLLLSGVLLIITAYVKGFISADKQATLATEQDVLLITYRRRNHHQQNSLLEQWTLNSFRRLIETVFSQLDGHLPIQDTGAKTDIGLMKRTDGTLLERRHGLDRPGGHRCDERAGRIRGMMSSTQIYWF
jgi:hypothetical protein